jgi:hypothetical protein
MKPTFIWLFLSCCATSQVGADGLSSDELPGVPDAIHELSRWPKADTLAEKQVTTTSVRDAVADAERWLALVIDPVWLAARREAVCTKGEYERRHIVRHKWISQGYRLGVAQTASVFMMEIAPEAGRIGGDSKEARFAAARELCGRVFAKTGKRHTSQGEEVVIEDLNRKILDFSFDLRTTQEVTNRNLVLVGRPKTWSEEGFIPPQTGAEADAQAKRVPWEQTIEAWMYWLRDVRWFAEVDRVVVFFLKKEAGPVALDYGGLIDDKWFK